MHLYIAAIAAIAAAIVAIAAIAILLLVLLQLLRLLLLLLRLLLLLMRSLLLLLLVLLCGICCMHAPTLHLSVCRSTKCWSALVIHRRPSQCALTSTSLWQIGQLHVNNGSERPYVYVILEIGK
jgi:hypothetical protein